MLGMACDWNKPIWYFDYPMTLLYSAWLGRFVQLSADSSEYLQEKVVETMIMAIALATTEIRTTAARVAGPEGPSSA